MRWDLGGIRRAQNGLLFSLMSLGVNFSFFFLFFSLFFFRFSWSANESSKSWLAALDFYEAEQDLEAWTRIADFAVKKFPLDIKIFEKILIQKLSLKDRQKILEGFVEASRRGRCSVNDSKFFCEQIKRLWNSRVSNLLFFEDSDAKILKSRNMIREGKCHEARALADEIERKEGLNTVILDLREQIFLCLGDHQSLQAFRRELARWSFPFDVDNRKQ